MAEYVVIAGLLAGGYLLTKKNTAEVTSPAVTPSKSTPPPTGIAALLNPVPAGPVPPHLIAGAPLLTDQQITDMEITIIANHFTNPGKDKPNFTKLCLMELAKERLLQTDISPGTNCGGGTYAGPPLAITATKTGAFALNSVSSVGSVAGGAFGSANGLFGTGFAASGSALGTAIPIVGTVLGIGLSIFNAISAHHQAAVRNEQGLECQLAPPADYSLQVIEQAVTTGTITVQQGQTALNSLYSDFVKAAKNGQSGQLEDAPGKLNAMGWYAHLLHAIIIKKQNRYASLAA